MDAAEGDTEIDVSEGVAVSPVLLETPELLALMVLVPAATAVTSPEELIFATPVLLELHVAEVVIFAVLPSLNVPVAVYCSVLPVGKLAFSGLNAIDFNVIDFTVSEVEPELAPFRDAVIVVTPALTPVARPVLLIVA